MFDMLSIVVLVGAIALLIMSAVILGSSNKLAKKDALKSDSDVKNVKNTSTILLIISIVVVLVYGVDMYLQYSKGHGISGLMGSSKSSVSYYF